MNVAPQAADIETFPFLDVGFTYRALQPALDAAYRDVMGSGRYIGGEALTRFEARFAARCGVAHCVGLGNGLDALVLPLRALGIGPGDEVIVSGHTFVATWLAVAQCGATPVPVDADPVTMNIDVSLVAAAITPRTRAILAVHLYGAPADCTALAEIAQRHNLWLIEDAAQAHDALHHGRPAGGLGVAAGFSFYPGKNLGAFGDGGALMTDDTDLADRVRMLANYGARRKYEHDLAGGNSRLDPLQAAFLDVKLDALADWTARRREIAAVYLDRLNGQHDLRLPAYSPHDDPAWHLFVVRHARRDALLAALAARGVEAALHYPVPNHQSGAFRATHGALHLPVTEAICATCLSLPIGPHLSPGDAHEIADRVIDALASI
ncbi:DegT/DnrJ/EryC1/StrS family aminotransferase [Halodurantibacterium flavum]|uniref:DegT/DnrJ/EryC1/StrS family aminotransferase n=1 Tax=Halodurantibacterium flavum TaxID=1382802 RepID=A0ABW4S5T7_9RHOB